MSNESPIERWRREKARLADGMPLEGVTGGTVVSNNSNLYKRPGEFCSHPEDMTAIMKGYKVCLACGQTIAEGVSRSREEVEEEMPISTIIKSAEINLEMSQDQGEDDGKKEGNDQEEWNDQEEGYVK
ncbi:MAG: hypothetical protein WC979_06960 [Candidatus Pacearchaeota archaeon]|jgi:hypothetical protein